ncbi:MAG: hypothetical protein MUO82_10760 [Candidatus Thermoplasmatota archaeon]|nr:hypothetical protein [Candidatus Thermoplasmatota archaeon]
MKIELTKERLEWYKNLSDENKQKFKIYLIQHDEKAYYDLIWFEEFETKEK